MTKMELLSKIRTGFNNVQKGTVKKRQKDWTQAFFQVLKDIGIQEGFKVYTGSFKRKIVQRNGGTEWLFDLCWSKEGRGKDDWKIQYKGLKLICESEWKTNPDEIIYDFQKLAVGKAEIKIMLIQYKTEEKFIEIKQLCEKSIAPKLYYDGATYILVGSGNGQFDKEVKWCKLWERK